MNFDLSHTIQILERTPRTLTAMLGGIADVWTASTGDPDRWQPYDVLGHLIHGEKTDWIPRAEIILKGSENRNFRPFDRTAQFDETYDKPLADLLTEFASLRESSLNTLHNWNLSREQLDLTGIHPEFGEVSMRQLLATWTVHDLTHVRQIVTEMALRYSDAVGPWKAYLSILR